MYTMNENNGIDRVRVTIYLKERKLAPLEPKLGYQRSKLGLQARQSPVYRPGTVIDSCYSFVHFRKIWNK